MGGHPWEAGAPPSSVRWLRPAERSGRGGEGLRSPSAITWSPGVTASAASVSASPLSLDGDVWFPFTLYTQIPGKAGSADHLRVTDITYHV